MGAEPSRTEPGSKDRDRRRARRRAARGDAEPAADALTRGLLRSAGAGPDALEGVLSRVGGAAREHLLQRLQHTYGNAQVGVILQRQAVARQPEVETAGETPAASGADRPTLRQGSSGPAVEQLQAVLNALGARPPLAVDGQFGPGTRAAVVAFQRSQGLDPDGVVGPKSWAALEGASLSPSADQPADQGIPAGAVVGSETPEQEVKADQREGDLRYEAGRYEEALPYYRRIYSLPEAGRAERANALHTMAYCHFHLGQKERAINLWEECLTFPELREGDRLHVLERIRELRAGEDPTTAGEYRSPTAKEQAAADAQALEELNAGNARGVAGDYAGALSHFENVYRLRAASPHLRLAAAARMGRCYQRLKDHGKTIDMYQEALGFPENAFNRPIGDSEPVSKEEVLASMRDARAGKAEKPTPEDAKMPPEEQDALMAEARALFRGGRYAECLEVLNKVYPATEDYERRAVCATNMGRCHQRLGDFEQAASLFMEALQYPVHTAKQRQELDELLRQARMREVGLHITPGKARTDIPPGTPQELFQAEVYFLTQGAALAPLGEQTLHEFADLLNQRHAAEPQIEISVTLVGHSSRRWRSAANDKERHELNEKLSQERAEAVYRRLVKEVPATTTADIIVDATGDQAAEKCRVGPEDNTWFFRGVTLVAEGRVGSAPPPEPSHEGAVE